MSFLVGAKIPLRVDLVESVIGLQVFATSMMFSMWVHDSKDLLLEPLKLMVV